MKLVPSSRRTKNPEGAGAAVGTGDLPFQRIDLIEGTPVGDQTGMVLEFC